MAVSTLLQLSGAHAATCNERCFHKGPLSRETEMTPGCRLLILSGLSFLEGISRIKIMTVELYCM